MLRVLLADDDRDDRFIFNLALSELPLKTTLTTVTDGEKLMTYLDEPLAVLPDVLFLDLNMPRKTGQQCLSEIKQNTRLVSLPVIIYSTSLRDETGDKLYAAGAHYYIQKTDISGLQIILRSVLTLIAQNKFQRPERSQFMFGNNTMYTLLSRSNRGHC